MVRTFRRRENLPLSGIELRHPICLHINQRAGKTAYRSLSYVFMAFIRTKQCRTDSSMTDRKSGRKCIKLYYIIKIRGKFAATIHTVRVAERVTKLEFILLTNYMEQSPFWQANSSSPSQNFPAFCVITRFIATFTRAHHAFLSWARSTQSTLSHPI